MMNEENFIYFSYTTYTFQLICIFLDHNFQPIYMYAIAVCGMSSYTTFEIAVIPRSASLVAAVITIKCLLIVLRFKIYIIYMYEYITILLIFIYSLFINYIN